MTSESAVFHGQQADPDRRKFLTHTLVAISVVGGAFAAVPFVESWLPSERARALGGPISLDTSGIDPGQLVIVTWRRTPIFVVRRTPAMVERIFGHDDELKDPRSENSQQPNFAENAVRARRADLLVAVGLCTHLGCLPKARFAPADPDLGAHWPGGFLCVCHGSRYDLAGRVFKGSPASWNLAIPPYRFQRDRELIVGG